MVQILVLPYFLGEGVVRWTCTSFAIRQYRQFQVRMDTAL